MRRIAFALLLGACGSMPGGGDDGGAAPDARAGATPDAGGTGGATVVDPSITDVQLEIDYESGEEPYTGPIIGFGDTFDLTIANLNRLFANHKQLAVPVTLANMQDIGPINDELITTSDALA